MLGVFSHDAGGAELTSSWLINNESDYLCCLEGPAQKIFQNKIPDISQADFKEVLDRSDRIITSTSWQSELEKRAISEAKKRKLHVTSLLDHWVNYEERFIFHNELILPDEIWVFDEYALDIAERTFPSTRISIKRNYYFDEILRDIRHYEKKTGENYILYCCSPIRKQTGDPDYLSEEYIIRYFLSNLHKLKPKTQKIVFRKHPSESEKKYQWLFEKYDLDISLSTEEDLLKDIMNAEIVAGFNSMAMVIGVLTNKCVVNVMPSNLRENTLPYTEIVQLESLAN